MNVGQNAPTASKKTPDQSDNSVKKPDRKGDSDEPKPRIVLTFRSEKPGAKSSNMKIVSSEEKHDKVDEVSPRRSSRARAAKYESEDENEASPKKDKSHVMETDESVSTSSKRSTRGRSKDTDSTPTTSKKEPVAIPTRLSRRIKPTAKVLENEELRIGLESQNNVRLGLSDKTEKSSEEGVRTRRSVRSKPTEEIVSHVVEKPKKSCNTSKVALESAEKDSDPNEVLKLKHLCELGLKAKSPEDLEETDGTDEKADAEEFEEMEVEGEESDDDDDHEEEIDDDSEVITKLLEADDDSDEEFTSRSRRPHRSRDLSESNSLPENTEPRRRSTRKRTRIYEEQWEDGDCKLLHSSTRKASPKRLRSGECDDVAVGSPAGGDEGSEATQPDDDETIVADCTCETPSNLYADPEDDTAEPIFCQAIESVDGVRVGCSHAARRHADGSRGELVRCGPRGPFIRVCPLHHHMMTRHMVCTTCALYCTQGIFYQCSKKHLFHLECGLLSIYEKKLPPGCPHCGFKRNQRRTPVNTQCDKVRVDMTCSNKRVFMHDQREQCTTAYLGFTPLAVLDESPVIPEDLLPSPPIDLKQLCQTTVGDEECSVDQLHEGIMAGETVEQLIPKIMSCKTLNAPLPAINGGTCMHAAARRGNLSAVYLLHGAGADLNASDTTAHTPLMAAVLALLETPDSKLTKKKITDKDGEEIEPHENEPKEEDSKIEDVSSASEIARGTDEELMKVIRYLVAAGCDIDAAGPDGMTALHMAAQYGGTAVCEVLLCAGARADPRDHGGWTPLVWAAESSHSQTVSLLLKHGADAQATDSEGNGAVHWCALSGAARVLHLLLAKAPAAGHAGNASADTPLHVAARQGHYACVVILLARGARTDVENSAGELPVEVCSGQCQSAITLNMQMTLALKPNSRRKLLKGDISRGREPYPIPCVNEIDDAVLPDDFIYVTTNVMPTNIVIDNSMQTMQGCKCVGGDCSSVECACVSLSVRRWTLDARLRANFPHHDPPMLFTCNATCGCDARKCTNIGLAAASAQGSVFVRSEVYRVGGACGWGLRTTTKIPRGTVVAEYCGELLTMSDADTRSNDQYMFALDVKPDLLEQCAEKTQLCIDAHAFGGAARFINHSCKPNLAPVRVFTHGRDLRLPHAQLFATRNIAPMDPLTFDYGDKFWSVKSKYMKCECGAPDCRYPTVKGESDS